MVSCEGEGRRSREEGEGEKEEEEVFDGSKAPPFRMAEIRASIPNHCWVKNPWRSLSYVLRDVSVVLLLVASAVYLDTWLYFPLYCAAQGTMFWAIFVLGHDCGHGSFSDVTWLNTVVGHVLHSSILVPYHAWRISHRTHHRNHGNVEKDETWVPMSENIYRKMDSTSRALRFTVPIPLFAFPLYLWRRSPGKSGSHFNPYSKLFLPGERGSVLTSSLCCFAVALLLSWLTFSRLGALQMLKLYWAPYTIFIVWLDFVTYMHHHGHEGKLPWYRGKEWSYLRGGLTTVDLDYGLFNGVHHDIGTHVVHHLFPQIPHYHLVEATEAAKEVMGEYYREPEQSGPVPFHLLRILQKSVGRDHFVSDDGDIVFYQTDGTNRSHPVFSRLLLRLNHLRAAATSLVPNILMPLLCSFTTKQA